MSTENRKLLYVILMLLLMVSMSYIKGYPKIPVYENDFVYKVERPVSDKEIYRGRTDENHIILTFDGGSGSESTREILSALEKHKVKSTFFLTGKWIENNPLLTILIHGDGHEIFSHTYNHPYLTSITDDEIRKELRDTESILFKLLGISSKPYFRPPYGDRDERVLKVASSEGYQSVYWTVDAMDWMESEGETDASVMNRIKSTLSPGNIYLMHLGDGITGRIMDELLTYLESKNYKVSSLTQGL